MEMFIIDLLRMIWNALFVWGCIGILAWFVAAVFPLLGKPSFGLYMAVNKKMGAALMGGLGVGLAKGLKFLLNAAIWLTLIGRVLVVNAFAGVRAHRAGRDPALESFPAWKDYFPEQKKKESGKSHAH